MIWWWSLLCCCWWWRAAAEDCEEARMRCAYRASCARALHSYMVDCSDVLAGRTARCPWSCRRALIQLASSEAGLALSACECGDNEFCRRSKERAEVCRAEVSAAVAEGTVVPCAVAEWICAADHLCSTALGYYHRLCRPMFLGRKCTPRCNNSLAILDRQPKAGKLRTCYCDGSEDFPCPAIKRNTQRLCYGRDDEWTDDPDNHLVPYAESGGGRETTAPPCALLCALLCSLALWTSSNNSFTGIFVSPDSSFSSRAVKDAARFFGKISWINVALHSAEVALNSVLNIHKHFFWTRAMSDWTFRTMRAIRIFLSSGTKTDLSYSSRAVEDTARFFGKMRWIHLVRQSAQVALKNVLNVHKHFLWTRATSDWTFRTIRAIRIFCSSDRKTGSSYSSRAVKGSARFFGKFNWINAALHSAQVALKNVLNIYKHFLWTRAISDWTFRTIRAIRIFPSSGTKTDSSFSSTAVKDPIIFVGKINVVLHSAQVAPKILFNIHKHFYWTREISDWTFRTINAMMVKSTRMQNFETKFVSCLKVHHSPVWYFKLKGLSSTTWPWWWTSEILGS